MGLEELLRVLREEAATEERALEEEAAREAQRIVAEARSAAEGLRAAALERERAARAERLRSARDASGLARERALLAESRRQLELLRAEALSVLPAAATDTDVERLVLELVEEAGPVEAILIVDPGFSPAARRAIAAVGRSPAPTVQEAAARRGGVELITGCLVLDDTLSSRLERAWPRLEAELARILFADREEAR